MKSQVNKQLAPALDRAAAPAGAAAVDAMALRLASEAPELADLAPDQLAAVARVVLGQRLAADLSRKAELAGIDYEAEKTTFLDSAGRTGSPNTRRAYAAALGRLEAFADRRALPVLALKPAQADDFAYALAAERRASASIRRDLAAASSFYTWLERRHETIRNPFRGTKARPAKKAARPAAYPSAAEIETILDALAGEARAAASVMAYRGLRVGGLPALDVWGNRFKTRSKGKDIAGELPAEALAAIRAACPDLKHPFKAWTGTRLEDTIRKTCLRLADAGKLAAPYSAHDLRHFYAVAEYRKDKDLHRVSKLLGHASLQVTELYLHGLGEVD
jgi:site-specific recombinase XerD